MSTYLLAFVVGEYDFVDGYVNDTLVRVYTPIGKSKLGEFALDVSNVTLNAIIPPLVYKFPTFTSLPSRPLSSLKAISTWRTRCLNSI